jgi:hypothetical protein
MEAHSGDELLQLPVRTRGIDLGRPIDLILDPAARRVLGFDVLCGDGRRRFLPLSAATLGADEIGVASALPLLEQLPYYEEEAVGLRDLRREPVLQRGSRLGQLRDVVIASDGRIEGLVLEGEEGSRRVPLDGLRLPRRSGT